MTFCNDLPPYLVFYLLVFEGSDVGAQRGVAAFTAVSEGAVVIVETCFKLVVCCSCTCFLLSAVLFYHGCLVDHAVQCAYRLLSAVAVCISGVCGAGICYCCCCVVFCC